MLLFFVSSCYTYAQYSSTNSISRYTLLRYDINTKGFYEPVENEMVERVDGVVKTYAFDKKASMLYVQTDNGNYKILLTKDEAKIAKKQKFIPQLTGNELNQAIVSINKTLEARYLQLNEQHQQELEAARQKEIEDSIAAIRKAEAIRAAKEKKRNDYKKAHKWMWLPTYGVTLTCAEEDCNKLVSEDSVVCVGIKNDIMYYWTQEYLGAGESFSKLHFCVVPTDLKNNLTYKYHLEVYGDSLYSHDYLDSDFVENINFDEMSDAVKKITKKLPYGYFEEWDWGTDYGNITFDFRYRNTNPKTIKYIDVYWKARNDVGDIRGTGHFKGTGPLEQYESASWNWDYSSYYVAGDTSQMIITKVILTYTNGSQKTLTGNMIRFEAN